MLSVLITYLRNLAQSSCVTRICSRLISARRSRQQLSQRLRRTNQPPISPRVVFGGPTTSRSDTEVHVTRSLIFTAVFLSFTIVVLAQQAPLTSPSTAGHQHGVGPTQVIDGSLNPELIPDSTACRLFFLVAGTAPNPKAEEKARQLAHVDKIGLNTEDRELLIPILNAFKAQYADLIQHYNVSAEALATAGQVPDVNAFLVQRENLVQETRDKLLKVLTPEGVNLLNQHLQLEKRAMRLVVAASH